MAANVWWVVRQPQGLITIPESDQAGAAAVGTVISGPYQTQAQAQAAIGSSSGSPGAGSYAMQPSSPAAPQVTQGVGSVPATLINWAAGVVGISPAIVAAQITDESGGNPGALSPTGAQGVAQFEPGTWQTTGCSGSPWNVNDAMRCYATLMYQLVQQNHGSVRDALAAYNAGQGNLAAGYGYADSILSAAGAPSGATASGGTGAAGGGATLTSASTRCLVGGNTFIPCLLDASQARGIIGGLCLLSGGLIAGTGILLIVVIGLGRSGAPQAALGAAEKLPGYGQAIRAVRAQGEVRTARRAGAQAARTTAARRQGAAAARKRAAGP